MGIVSSGIVPEQVPFHVAWRTIDGLKVRWDVMHLEKNLLRTDDNEPSRR